MQISDGKLLLTFRGGQLEGEAKRAERDLIRYWSAQALRSHQQSMPPLIVCRPRLLRVTLFPWRYVYADVVCTTSPFHYLAPLILPVDADAVEQIARVCRAIEERL